MTSFAFEPIPPESAAALKVTRGKSFSAGAVFINGKYLPPPYVVERRGTGIRINREQVTGQVVDWVEFIKAQPNHKVVRQEPPAEAPVPAPEPPPEPASDDDDLFADDAPAKKPVEVRRPVAVKPRPTVTYELTGEFVPNDETKAMVDKINGFRTEIDRTLRTGGFICFGDDYPQVTGDSRTFLDLLEKLPELQKNAKDEGGFLSGARRAGLGYLHKDLLSGFYRNRLDYRRLQERRSRLKKDSDIQKVLDEVSEPLL